jgi:hypothetical protein
MIMAIEPFTGTGPMILALPGDEAGAMWRVVRL